MVMKVIYWCLIFVGLNFRTLLVTLLAVRILRWLLDFWKICALLPYSNKILEISLVSLGTDMKFLPLVSINCKDTAF
jgi:hypothetical protein